MSWPSTDFEAAIQDELDDLRRRKLPRVVIVDAMPKGYEDKYPWKAGDSMLFLGELANMPGHCVVADRAGRVFWGFHTDNFREPTDDEL